MSQPSVSLTLSKRQKSHIKDEPTSYYENFETAMVKDCSVSIVPLHATVIKSEYGEPALTCHIVPPEPDDYHDINKRSVSSNSSKRQITNRGRKKKSPGKTNDPSTKVCCVFIWATF